MNKEIQFSGLSNQPSDYECPDGELHLSLNLIHEDAALHPIQEPKHILKFPAGTRLLFIHTIPGNKNYILTRDNYLLWLNTDGKVSEPTEIGHFPSLFDAVPIGNTIVISTEHGLQYILWKDGAYISLGEKPPFVPISFGLSQAGTLDDKETLKINYERADESRTRVVIADSEENTNAIYGFLLSNVQEKITSQGYFYQPFFVRYAIRLFDGSYIRHSAPILLLPTVLMPVMNIDAKSFTSEGTKSVETTLNVPYFSLDFKILPFGGDISLWSDIIAGIDIFISQPIYTYNQAGRITSTASMWSAASNYFNFNPEGLWPAPSIPDAYLAGHYAKTIDQYTRPYTFEDHTFSSSGIGGQHNMWNLPINENFHDQIKDVATFYKVASLKPTEIIPADKYRRLEIPSNALESLLARETLPDDYQSHCGFVPKCMYSFNSRLNIANVDLTPPKPFPILSCVQASTPLSGRHVSVTVYSRINGSLCYASNFDSSDANFYDLENSFPRYIFYPDASAYKMVLEADGKEYVIDLQPHQFLNGAFYYGTFAVDARPVNASKDPVPKASFVSLPNKVYTSQAGNPFFFPLLGINTIGSGHIFAICSAAKALSQGQFGQFPLYAFTDEGVWALETNAQGSYSAKQPITRDSILSGSAPLQLDSAVLFASDRGLMLLSGSQTQCISDSIGARPQLSSLNPQLSTLHTLLAHQGGCNCLSLPPLQQFLSGSAMLYDYSHQRIIVFNPAHDCALVYSLKSNKWGAMSSSLQSPVNSYPEALAVDRSGALLNFSADSGQTAKGLLLSRPIKLDLPDVLKTVTSVIMRGCFARGHVGAVLYGSRNLTDWHPVFSSKDHFLRAFSGTPYKYFRIALLTSLAPHESIFSASVTFNPRLTLRPR